MHCFAATQEAHCAFPPRVWQYSPVNVVQLLTMEVLAQRQHSRVILPFNTACQLQITWGSPQSMLLQLQLSADSWPAGALKKALVELLHWEQKACSW